MISCLNFVLFYTFIAVIAINNKDFFLTYSNLYYEKKWGRMVLKLEIILNKILKGDFLIKKGGVTQLQKARQIYL
jgi:hypothetical protein